MPPVKYPLYLLIDRDGKEVGPRYGGRHGYDHAEEYRRANDILHPTAQVVDARDLRRLPPLRRWGDDDNTTDLYEEPDPWTKFANF